MSPNGTGRKLTYWSIQEGNKPKKKKLKKSGKNKTNMESIVFFRKNQCLVYPQVILYCRSSGFWYFKQMLYLGRK